MSIFPISPALLNALYEQYDAICTSLKHKEENLSQITSSIKEQQLFLLSETVKEKIQRKTKEMFIWIMSFFTTLQVQQNQENKLLASLQEKQKLKQEIKDLENILENDLYPQIIYEQEKWEYEIIMDFFGGEKAAKQLPTLKEENLLETTKDITPITPQKITAPITRRASFDLLSYQTKRLCFVLTAQDEQQNRVCYTIYQRYAQDFLQWCGNNSCSDQPKLMEDGIILDFEVPVFGMKWREKHPKERFHINDHLWQRLKTLISAREIFSPESSVAGVAATKWRLI